MVSFSDKLKEKESSHAYVLGAKFYVYSMQTGTIMASPFTPRSKEDKEWWDGYFDSEALHMGAENIKNDNF